MNMEAMSMFGETSTDRDDFSTSRKENNEFLSNTSNPSHYRQAVNSQNEDHEDHNHSEIVGNQPTKASL